MPLSTDQLDYVRNFVHSRAAIVLDEKDYLIESRLHTLAGQQGFPNAACLIEAARRQPICRALEAKIIDALTTNETYFFRDAPVFDFLRDSILPSVRHRNAASRKLRVWSAACATGQEPYSVAMLLNVHFPGLDSWNVEILATDISDSALERAGTGRYSQAEVYRGLPASMMRFFEKQGQWWQMTQEFAGWCNSLSRT